LAVERGEQIVVGVNKFRAAGEKPLSRLRVDPAVGEQQAARLARLRQARDQASVNQLLGRLKAAAEGTENLMPHFLACVEAYATLGEICDVLRAVFGEYKSAALV